MPDHELITISDMMDALHFIKDICVLQHERCAECPFYCNDCCQIQHTSPDKWDLKSHYIWRAFK